MHDSEFRDMPVWKVPKSHVPFSRGEVGFQNKAYSFWGISGGTGVCKSHTWCRSIPVCALAPGGELPENTRTPLTRLLEL